MHLAFHGGKCCGIKTIYGFDEDPYTGKEWDTEPKLEKVPQKNNDKIGYHVRSSDRFFSEAAPQERPVDRLDRYLEFLSRVRPEGIVEVALVAKAVWGNQTDEWEPVLFERGFKMVTEARNSNTKNTIRVYHLVMTEDTKPKPKKAKLAPWAA